MLLPLRRAELVLLLAVAGCATPRHHTLPTAASIKIGKPYQVFGIWYVPADDRSYDQHGIASWYGPGFHALSTANGESYDQDGLTAAHKTLPMPSYVEIQNLDNGRKLTVRINDRGPFVAGRIIDLSRRSAQLLGVDRAGTAKVRVRRVFPDAAVLANLAPTTSVISAPAAPTPAIIPPVSSVAPTTQTLIQVAALSDAGRVAWLSGYLTAFGSVNTQRSPSGLTRVRLGPYATPDAANAVLAQLHAAGYSDAHLVQGTPVP